MKKKVVFSIIIPTHNSEKFLDGCLHAIYKQSFSQFEVIVVDQESGDNTVSIAKKYGVRILSVKKAKFYSPPSKSRNVGAKIAKGTYLYHMDSDMEIPKHLL